MDKKNTSRLRKDVLKNIYEKHKGNNAETQANRALEGFQKVGSLTTQDLRHDLDIMDPAGRVNELRKRNYDIRTMWEDCPTTLGKIHRMARYVYVGKIEVSI